MTDLINIINKTGEGFCGFAITMLIQSGILIVMLYLMDLLIRKHARAVFRYCIWILVFVKLVLPVSLTSPISMGRIFGDKLTINKTHITASDKSDEPVKAVASKTASVDDQANNSITVEVPADAALSKPVDAAGNHIRSAEWPRQFTEVEDVPVENPAKVATPTESIPISWKAVVFLSWLIGVIVLCIFLLQRFFFVKSLLAQSDTAAGPLQEILDRCRERVGVKRFIEFRLSKNMLSPAACGLTKPVILMPAALLDTLDEEKLQAVLIHELAHIKRGDLWVNFMQTILQIAYFYNPLLWFANAVVRGLREKAVDEMVLTKLGDKAATYSTTLVDVAEIAFSKPHFSLRLVGVVESKKALTSRIKHILSRPFPKSAKLGILGLTAIFITAAVLLPMAKAKQAAPEFTKKVTLPYSIWMADITSDDKMKILDFASGEIVELSGFNKGGEFVSKVNSMSQGDIYVSYRENINKPMITVFKGAGLGGRDPEKKTSFVSPIPIEVPWVTTVKTQQGHEYLFSLTSFDKNECVIEYGPLNRAAKGAIKKAGQKSDESRKSKRTDTVISRKFFDAVISGDLAKVKQLVSQEFDVNAIDSKWNGDTALHKAGPWGKTDIARLLIDAGADVDIKNNIGQTPLICAASYSHQAEPIAKLLIENGADVTVADNKGMTALHHAATGTMSEMLLDKGADIHARDKRGWTPLHYDCNWGRLSAVKYLVEKGADTEAKDNEARTPLMLASTNANSAVVKYLLSQGAKINTKDSLGRTSLHLAVIKNEKEIRKLLDGQTANGSNKPSAVDNHYKKISNVIEILLANGADVTAKDNKGSIALDYAKAAENKMAVETLSSGDEKLIGSETLNSSQPISTRQLINSIAENERKIRDIQLRMVCKIIEDDWLFYDYQWGYDHGKEFHSGKSYSKDRLGQTKSSNETKTYDGEHYYSYYEQIEDNKLSKSGSVGTSDMGFGGYLTFNLLLGYSSYDYNRSSLSELLAGADSVTIKSKTESIDGHPCYVVDVVNCNNNDLPGRIYNTRLWIDISRDFRILKQQLYHDNKGKNFKKVEWQIDNVILANIDNVWLPIQGERTFYRSSINARRLTIDPASIKLNKGIADDQFKIDFPNGCEVYNYQTEARYIVGQPSEKESAYDDQHWIDWARTLSVDELIGVIKNTKKLNSIDLKKVLASVNRLVETGSKAVPTLGKEIVETDNAKVQSFTALILRAIGDPNAVPYLIDTLPRSLLSGSLGFGSDNQNSQLEKTYRQYQIDPSRDSLGLSYPVREITIALEKLTGYSLGHDHFYAHDSKGNRLGSYTITPEIIDRKKARLKEVADRWRKWWQENKQTVLAGQLPVEQPKEIAPKKKANKTSQIKGVLGPPDGAELSFAIVPEIGTDISKSQYQEYVDDLNAHGPFRGSMRGDSFQWSSIKDDCPGIDSLPVETYKDNKYVLLCARKEYVFRPELEGKRIWGLRDAVADKDSMGKPAIRVKLDQLGCMRFYKFTEANLGKRMAIDIAFSGFGVVAAPVINSPIEMTALITGNFTEQQAKALAELLKKGMPSTVPGPSDPVAKIPPKRTRAYISISYITVWQACQQIDKLLAMNHLEYSLKLAKSLEWQLTKIKQKYDDPQYQIIVNESIQKLKLFSSAVESKDSVAAKKTFEFFYQSVNEILESTYEAMGRSSKLANAKAPKIHQYHGNIAVLEDDIVLEFVGTRNYRGDNKQFVSPEGEPLDNAPYKTTALDIPQKKGFAHYELAARVTGKPDISLTWAGIAGIYDSYTATPIGHDGKRISDLNVCTTAVVDSVSGATVRVGVSAKPWEVLATHPAAKDDHEYSTRLGSAVFGKAYEKAGKAIVSFFYELASKQNLLPWRVVAVTDDEKEIPGKTKDNQLKTSDSAEYNFDVPISSIKEFRFQARAFQCVEFDSISFKPRKGSVPRVRIYPSGYFGTFSSPDRPQGQIETVESNLGTSFPGLVKNFKSSYFASGIGDFCRKVRFDTTEKDLITALDNAANISFKYSDLKWDSTLVEHVCSVGPVNDKRQFWQEQKQKNIICAQEKKPSAGGGRSIYVGVDKLDDVNVRVYFMYAGWADH